MEVPHILSDPARKFVTEKSSHSVFYIRSNPRGLKFKTERPAKEAYVKLMTRAMSEKERLERKDWLRINKILGSSTGFVYEKSKTGLRLLTAAHIIQEAYRAGYPLDNTLVGAVNQAYYFDVICVHKGREFLLSDQGNDQDDSDGYIPARVLAISSMLDLMVLEVSSQSLGLICKCEHNTINGISQLPPHRSEPVLQQGWPKHRVDTSIWGDVSTVRAYKWITRDNPLGYGMRLTELPGLEAQSGCSGGPLVNGRLECVGVFHGALNSCGYAVSVSDIRDFLISLGMMEGPLAAGTSAAAAAAAKEGDDDDSSGKHDGAAKGKGLEQGQWDGKDEHEPGREKGGGGQEVPKKKRSQKPRRESSTDYLQWGDHSSAKLDDAPKGKSLKQQKARAKGSRDEEGSKTRRPILPRDSDEEWSEEEDDEWNEEDEGEEWNARRKQKKGRAR